MIQQKNIRLFILISIIGFFIISIFNGCRKDDVVDTSPSLRLKFSEDTIMFDTVFTTIGSTTQWLKVYNPSAEKINISRIRLAGGPASFYRLNVDGTPGIVFSNVEIEGKDSLWIFVEVTVNPNNVNNPMIISDSIVFELNGNTQDIDLVAWGQDAHFITPDKFFQGLPPFRIVAGENENINWTNDKPYVIYGYAVVDSTGTLNIDAGCRIYLHKNSGIWVYKEGSIRVNGTKDEPVVFRGDRLESYYDDVAGQWDRIWLNESSRDNVFNYAHIRNAYIGIQAEALDYAGSGSLRLNNCKIENMVLRSLFSKTYKIEAYNSIIANSGEVTALLSAGGSYEFIHCTFGGYWNAGVRQTPLMVLTNFYEDKYAGITYTGNLSKALFANCIIYGNNQEEILLTKHSNSSLQFNYEFNHCVIKTQLAQSTQGFVNVFRNQNPMMIAPTNFVFKLNSNSPCINAGNPLYALPVDIEDNPRDSQPDIGAWEYIAP